MSVLLSSSRSVNLKKSGAENLQSQDQDLSFGLGADLVSKNLPPPQADTMPFGGILEDKSLPHVPGTVILNEEVAHSEGLTGTLRHGKGKNAHVVLVPQPSDDPNDPLNWSFYKKLFIMLTLGFGTCLCAATISPLLNAGLFTISLEFGRPIGDITLLSGYQLLVAGSTAPFISAFSRKYGKRPCFLFSSLFGLIGSIIGSVSDSYDGLLAARVVQGFSLAAYESLVVSTIGDLYFVHERGVYSSCMQFLLGGVSNFSSVITGQVTAELGWKWLFHLLIIMLGLQTALLFLFCPETSYNRDKRYEIDTTASDDLGVEKAEVGHVEDKASDQSEETAQPTLQPIPAGPVPARKTFWQELAVFTGSYSDENLLQLVIAPFAVCLNVAVLWVVVVSGFVTSAYVAQAYVLAQIFSQPPYLLTPAGVGNLSLGPFVGGILGAIAIALVLDPSIKWLSARNHGVYEPEYRLAIMVLGLVCGGALMAWGEMLDDTVNLYACAVMHGVVIFGVMGVAIGSAAYALDAYRDMSNEIFVSGIILKNFLFYAYSYFVNDWTADAGPAEVFFVFGGAVIALTLTTIPLYVYGKR
ncbi:uncharacterized protein L3040_009305 [Drepanopeziza brunnea f. sp. 'multigermtubi']|uniref:uncharacterized protein n=1 Tax=Drepanopeziza brunnea f. sp. 'multigermtubi' TaxID=698441 RepID=UPI002399CCB9|nr:hypothetical protein L3040_009305 [Drepanopeziza brunnea f. sp. 'multigermtubi']